MRTLVVGATGATGQLLAAQLLERGQAVTAVVRSPDRLPADVRDHERLTVVQASLLDLDDDEMVQLVAGCDAVASCLGHNLSFQGMYGQPRRLVTDAIRRLCGALQAGEREEPSKVVLMNTTGYHNRELDQPISIAQRSVVGTLRLLLPPQVDNEQAAEFLWAEIGQHHPNIAWAVVRPDNLIDQETVTEYEIYPSPTRSAIFDAGKTSRINVAHFMAELITNDDTWQQWRGQMPVIYNKDDAS